ncbi:MFS transporter [Psychrobium sp. 1_MG-2023]|uniref:MFS transporter n=1 Tax=Psychrobium sp. 1_MG-2023 TaxID=3062624 RepID=UPI002680D9B2|nr:MFS transporter [Psychrobium sp. 1_MG-2023]MDP2559647.1 MFS transporter [Psychrobium sp. 1_MG-2023]
MLQRAKFFKLPATSLTTYFCLAFIAMAGLSYINFLPGVVNALAGGIGFNEVEAGEIVASNGYGGLLGSIIAIFLVRKVSWQPAIVACLVGLVFIDITTAWINHYGVMLGWRFLAGVLGGLCVGVAFSVLARMSNPDRAFGALLFVQFTIGSIVISILPGLEALVNAYAAFYIMASISLLSVIIMLLLPALTLNDNVTERTMTLSGGRAQVVLLLLAITLYQVAASAIWAYVGLIGHNASFSPDDVTLYIAITGLLGLIGAMLPVINGKRYGRLYWVVGGLVMSLVSALLLSVSQLSLLSYVIAMALLFFSWPAVYSYLLAVTAELDESGRLSTIAAMVSSVGLASGPLLASALLDTGDYSTMLYSCAVFFLVSLLLLLKPVRAQEQTHEEQSSSDLSSQYQS